MGTSIVAVWVINFIAGVVLLFEKMPNPVLGWGIRLGLLIALVGMALAFTMTSPNTTQMTALQSGQTVALIGAHNVNALVDGQSRMIPFLGWNMDGGDLRIAHFIGLHAIAGAAAVGLIFAAPYAETKPEPQSCAGLGRRVELPQSHVSDTVAGPAQPIHRRTRCTNAGCVGWIDSSCHCRNDYDCAV